MIIYKKCRVVMLPTEKASFLYKRTDLNTLHIGDNIVYNHDPLRVNQHIYITSDDKIRVGDWFLYDSKFVCKAELINEAGCYILTHLPNGLEYECNFGNHSKKIIATTDKIEISHNFDYTQLFPDKKDFRFYLPQPSYSFVQEFIDAYNSGAVISEVNVSYQEGADCGSSMCKNGCKSEGQSCSGYYAKPIVNQENFIDISKIKKENWTREEHLSDLKKLCAQLYFSPNREVDFSTEEELFKWIEEQMLNK